jgi:hypothetical protein
VTFVVRLSMIFAKPGLAIGKYPAIPTIHLKSV